MLLPLLLTSCLGLALGAVQTCSPADCIPRAITADFTFVLDVSSSIGGPANFNLVKQWLADFASGVTLSPEDSQIAIYTYATNAKSYSTLKAGSDSKSLQNIIQSISYDGVNDRQIYQALTKEESELTAINGFRAGYKHVMVIISGDKFTGQNIVGSNLMSNVQNKYDLVLVIGLGYNAAANQVGDLKSIAGAQSSLFLAINFDQLTYATQWLYQYSCPGTHMVTPTTTTTVMPTPNPSVPCSLGTLNYDVYLIVDVSTSLSASDFAAMKQSILDFIGPIPIGNLNTQFALEGTAIDTDNYYTGFHSGQDRNTIINVVKALTQDGSTGQTLKLSLQAIQNAYLAKGYTAANKVVVYYTGTTNFDQDPNALMKQLSTQYGLKALAVQWGNGASTSALASFTGASDCVQAATTTANRASVASWLQTKMCNKVFCL